MGGSRDGAGAQLPRSGSGRSVGLRLPCGCGRRGRAGECGTGPPCRGGGGGNTIGPPRENLRRCRVRGNLGLEQRTPRQRGSAGAPPPSFPTDNGRWPTAVLQRGPGCSGRRGLSVGSTGAAHPPGGQRNARGRSGRCVLGGAAGWGEEGVGEAERGLKVRGGAAGRPPTAA